MINAIVTRLKTGVIKTVYRYGETVKPGAYPYIVVKRERAMNRWRWRIIVHVKEGQNDALDLYVDKDLPALLRNFSGTDSVGNVFKLDTVSSAGDVTSNGDGSIFRERLFYSPLIDF